MSVDDFLKKASAIQKTAAQAKYDDLRGRRKNELELWHHWNDNGRQHADLEPLLTSLDPVIQSEATKKLKGLGGSMPHSALKQELRIAAVKGLESYDPEKGALFNHINNSFRRTSDVIAGMRNAKYTPRKVTELYQAHLNVQNELAEELGRPPTVQEIQARMPRDSKGKLPRIGDLRRLRKATSPEMFSDFGSPEESIGGNDQAPVGVHAAFSLIKPQLTAQQKDFFALHYPHPEEDKESASIKQIAKIMKLPEHRVYRIKQQVEKELGAVLKKT